MRGNNAHGAIAGCPSLLVHGCPLRALSEHLESTVRRGKLMLPSTAWEVLHCDWSAAPSLGSAALDIMSNRMPPSRASGAFLSVHQTPRGSLEYGNFFTSHITQGFYANYLCFARGWLIGFLLVTQGWRKSARGDWRGLVREFVLIHHLLLFVPSALPSLLPTRGPTRQGSSWNAGWRMWVPNGESGWTTVHHGFLYSFGFPPLFRKVGSELQTRTAPVTDSTVRATFHLLIRLRVSKDVKASQKALEITCGLQYRARGCTIGGCRVKTAFPGKLLECLVEREHNALVRSDSWAHSFAGMTSMVPSIWAQGTSPLSRSSMT